MKVTAVLDACVLYGAYPRDLLLTFMEESLFIGHWNEQILDEYSRNLIKNRPELINKVNRTIKLIKEFFPEALVEGFESLEQSLELPDPNDRHVLAAAIQSESQFIVTHNLKDFPNGYLAEFNVEAISLDWFLYSVINDQEEVAKIAFLKMVGRYKKEPKTPEAIIERLEKEPLSTTIELIRRWI